MHTETEAKFLDVDFEPLRARLQELGGKCTRPMQLMRRAIIDHPSNKDAFIRVRHEGDKITLAYKQFDSLSVDGAKEIETTVGSFEDTVKIFEAAGLRVRSMQESKRETWKLDDVETMLDEWPWLKPYIEIEGSNEQQITRAAEQLDLNWNDAVFGDVMSAYRAEYPHLKPDDMVGTLPLVRFSDPLPDMLKG